MKEKVLSELNFWERLTQYCTESSDAKVLVPCLMDDFGGIRESDLWLYDELNKIGLKHYYRCKLEYGFVGYFGHGIYTEKRSKYFFGLILKEKVTREKVAEIVSEPSRNKPGRYLTFLKYNGLEIEVLNKDYEEQLELIQNKFKEKYERK